MYRFECILLQCAVRTEMTQRATEGCPALFLYLPPPFVFFPFSNHVHMTCGILEDLRRFYT